MKLRLSALVAIIALLAAGCKSNGNQELLERDLRTQEDQIYQLQDQLADTQRQLEDCRREKSDLKKQSRGESGGPAGVGEPPTPLVTPGTPESPDGSPRGNSPDAPSLPKIDPGTPVPPIPPPGSGRGLLTPKSADAPPSDSLAPLAASPAGSLSVVPPSDPAVVQRIAINPILTGPHSFGPGAAGPSGDGVQLNFSPRDSENRPINAPGEVSIVVIDPEVPGAAARVARWDFTADEAASHYQQTALAKGFRFQLLWPNKPPEHERVRLYVRFTTPDGRKFEAEHTLHLGARTAQSENWSQPTIQKWEPSAAPLGAQFDPARAPPHDTPAAARSVMVPATPSAPAPSANGRPVWSPFR